MNCFSCRPRNLIVLIGFSLLWSTSLLFVHRMAKQQKPVLSIQNRLKEPSIDYELIRRRIETNIREMSYFAAAILGNNSKHYFLKNILLADMNSLRLSDSFEQWRTKELRALGEIVQNRLHYIQNPSQCSTARKLICEMKNSCGFGCEISRVVSCLIAAYSTKSTLILDDRDQLMLKESGGWDGVFIPLSETCRSIPEKIEEFNSDVTWFKGFESGPTPSFLPLAIPRDLAQRLIRVHGEPSAWWVGQFVNYTLRYQTRTRKLIEEVLQTINFRSPIVGWFAFS